MEKTGILNARDILMIWIWRQDAKATRPWFLRARILAWQNPEKNLGHFEPSDPVDPSKESPPWDDTCERSANRGRPNSMELKVNTSQLKVLISKLQKCQDTLPSNSP